MSVSAIVSRTNLVAGIGDGPGGVEVGLTVVQYKDECGITKNTASKPARDQPISDQSISVTVRDQPVRNQLVVDLPMSDQPVRDQPSRLTGMNRIWVWSRLL